MRKLRETREKVCDHCGDDVTMRPHDTADYSVWVHTHTDSRWCSDKYPTLLASVGQRCNDLRKPVGRALDIAHSLGVGSPS